MEIKKNKYTIDREFLILLISSIITFSFVVKDQFYIGIFFILLYFFIFLYMKKTIKEKVLFFSLFFLFSLIYCLLPDWYTYKKYSNTIKWDDHFFYIRNKLFSYLDNNFSENNLSSFYKFFLFNFKDENSYVLYRKLSKLGISFMFVVSGFHINLIFKVIDYLCFKRIKKTQIVIQLFIILFYGYFIGYSLSVLRVFLMFFFKRFKMTRSNSDLLSAFVLLFVFYRVSTNYGFLMMYLCVLIIKQITRLKMNFLVQILLINIGCNLITLPIILDMTGKYNPLSLFFSLFFSPFIGVYYFWLLITFWIPDIAYFQNKIYTLLLYIVDLVAGIDFILNIKTVNKFLVYSSYFVFFLLFKIKKNKKMWNYYQFMYN